MNKVEANNLDLKSSSCSAHAYSATNKDTAKDVERDSNACWKKDVFVKQKCPCYWPIPKMAKVTRNANVQYESLNIYYFIMNIFFLQKYVKCQGQKV